MSNLGANSRTKLAMLARTWFALPTGHVYNWRGMDHPRPTKRDSSHSLFDSDILAELDLPASGISRMEDTMRLPKGIHFLPEGMPVEKEQIDIMFYYSAQVSLRKILNKVHFELYKEERKCQFSLF